MTHPAVLIKNIWQKYVGNFKNLLLVSLPLGAAMAAASVVAIFFPLKYLETVLPLPRIATIVIYSVVAAIYMIFSFGSTIALFLNAERIFAGHKPALKEAYRGGAKLFLHVLLASLLRSLIITLGLILLIVPGVIWGIRYMFTEMTVIFEGKRGLAALRRSREITNGKMFALFIDLICLVAILAGAVIIISWVVSLVLYVIGSIVYALSGAAIVITAMTYVTYAVILIIRWAALTIPFLALVSLYRDFKETN